MSMGLLLRNSFLGIELGPWCALAAGSLSGSAGAVELVNFAEAVIAYVTLLVLALKYRAGDRESGS